MGIKPIDLQVNISQINHVARIQHNEQGHFRDVQLQQGQHVLKEADAKAHTILQTHQSENEESTVKDKKERSETERREEERRHRENGELEAEEVLLDSGDEKGHLFDGFS